MEENCESQIAHSCSNKKGNIVITIEQCKGGAKDLESPKVQEIIESVEGKGGAKDLESPKVQEIVESVEGKGGAKDLEFPKVQEIVESVEGQLQQYEGQETYAKSLEIFPSKTKHKQRPLEIEVKFLERGENLFSDDTLGGLSKSKSPSPSVDESYSEVMVVYPETPICSICPRAPSGHVCEGPPICIKRKPPHFSTDGCKLSDPNKIGRSILELHKKGLIKKNLYPLDFIETKVPEIPEEKEIVVTAKEVSPDEDEAATKQKEPEGIETYTTYIEEESSSSTLSETPSVVQKKSGCLCK